MTFTEEKNIPGIALFLDLKKAFDTIEWDFINSCLRFLTSDPISKTGLKSYTIMCPAAL